MRKSINILFVVFVLTIMTTLNVNAASVMLGIECGTLAIDSSNEARKYQECDINLIAPEGSIAGGYLLELKYNTPNDYSDFEVIADGNAWVNDITKTKTGGEINVLPYGGQYGTIKLMTIIIYEDASLSAGESGGTINIVASNPNNGDEGTKILNDVCLRINAKETDFVKEGLYIYSTYNFDFAYNYHESTCGKIAAFKGTIDKTTIPEGIELVDGYMNTEDATMTFNKENGQFILDFNDLEYPEEEMENPTTYYTFGNFTVKYKITDSTLLEDYPSINLTDISYVNLNKKNQEVYEEGYFTTNFFATEKGDWNGDFEYNLVDLIAYRMYLAGNDMSDYYEGELTEARFNIVNLNEDEEISILDLIAARKIIVGLPIE